MNDRKQELVKTYRKYYFKKIVPTSSLSLPLTELVFIFASIFEQAIKAFDRNKRDTEILHLLLSSLDSSSMV